MKKIAIAMLVCATVTSVYAQGSIIFNNRQSDVFTRIYTPEPGNSTVQIVGNTDSDTPRGNTIYHGTGLGLGYSAELWGAAGANQSVSSLAALAGSRTTFYTTASKAGQFIAPVDAIVVPGSTIGGSATFQVRAWNNGSGVYTDWSSAVSAGQDSGASPLFSVAGLGGGTTTPPNLVGLQSFSLVTTSAVPEPSTIALGVIGAAALLFRRRK